MKVINRSDKKVRIIIGKFENGHSSVTKPIRTIVVYDTTTEEVHKKIMEVLNGI